MRTDTIIIGAGQAGLALSRCLTERGRDHVVLERGRVAQRWLGSWDSLRLLTPNWMTRLPGWSYRGNDPDGFMTATEVVDFFDRYARSFGAPIEAETAVERVDRVGASYRVVTSNGTWSAGNVVIATGATDRPHVPAMAGELVRSVHQLRPREYRRPAQLPDGGVLVVGAAATAVQLADEIVRTGRRVVLAVGDHTRGVRTYRGRDLFAWLDATGRLDAPIETMSDPQRARRAPSLQLVGGRGDERMDLGGLHERGVELTGRVVDASGWRVYFADDLPRTTAAADARLRRVLASIDRYIECRGIDAPVAEPIPDTTIPAAPAREIDLHRYGISSVLWATGYRRDYSWLHVPVLDGCGEIVQHRGVTEAPGLYVLGLRFQSRRNSNFIDGVGRDAAEIANHIASKDPSAVRMAV